MDGEGFDRIAAALATAPSRRAALRLLVGSALGAALGLRGRREAGATHFGCKDVGTRCSRKRPEECCSGVCRKRKCRAHHQDVCTAGDDYCDGGSPSCNNHQDCVCYRTIGNASFCGTGEAKLVEDGRCERDTDCEAVAGPGAACVDCALYAVPVCVAQCCPNGQPPCGGEVCCPAGTSCVVGADGPRCFHDLD